MAHFLHKKQICIHSHILLKGSLSKHIVESNTSGIKKLTFIATKSQTGPLVHENMWAHLKPSNNGIIVGLSTHIKNNAA
jgi:hypothetical protein